MPTIYSGPGKIYASALSAYWAATVLWPEGENGQLKYEITQEKDDFAQAMHGRVGSTLGDTTGKVSITPFDNWSALSFLFPPYIGATTNGGGSGALAIGTRPHNPAGGSDVTASIWNPDGFKVALKRMAVIKHPELHLGVGKPLFGPVEIAALPSSGVYALGGAAAQFHTVTESAAADPGGQVITTDFIRESWTAAWGAVAGFGGDGGAPMQAEEQWVITNEIRYSPLKVQKQTVAYKLDSVAFMARARLFGPTFTQIEASVLTNRATGSRFANAGNDLALTSASGKTVTLKNADLIGEGFEFGGTKLGVGEVGFITQTTFTAGAPNPLIVFSS